ncbi:hypothetical protein JTE90_002844 [Oedothorax gibbosus]|uniref:Activating transcription factor 7-interacting protein Fn3 domain-containing protein n=1 Tax=Oedothorax gibbosus TaxID=931172 RepID=A0AAV6UGN5_9ARAC|nr:hypothetical protein JTE90_002844 [Oedothorax gibbosus]
MEDTCKKAKAETQCKVEIKKEPLENQEEANPSQVFPMETQCKVEIKKEEPLENGEANSSRDQSADSLLILRQVNHLAPFPPLPPLDNIPPKPLVKAYCRDRDIVLEWDMPNCAPDNRNHAPLTGYAIYFYEGQKNIPVTGPLWKKFGRRYIPKGMNVKLVSEKEEWKRMYVGSSN